MENEKITIEELVQTEGWKKFTKRLELYSAIFFAATIIMMLVGYTENGLYRQILVMTLGLFTILCFFLGFSNFISESRIFSVIFYKIYGWGLSLTFIISIVIQLEFGFPKETMTILVLIMLSLSTLLGIRERMSENINGINWLYFTRIIIAAMTLLYFVLLKK